MKKNDGYKKIKSLFYIVAIISMIIAIVGKVRAEEMNSDLQQIVNGYIQEYSAYSNVSIPSEILSTIYSNCPYVQIYGISGYDDKYIDFYCDKNLGLLYCRYNGWSYNVPMYINVSNRNYVCASSSSVDLSGNKCYRIYFTTSNYRIYEIDITNNSIRYDEWGYTSRYFYGFSSDYTEISGSAGLWSNSSRCDKNIILSYGDIYSQNYTSFDVAEDTWEPVTVDDNFIIFKSYGVGGMSDPLLNIQYADNIFSQGYTYTSSTTYSLTFDVDGTETTVSISSSAYPDDFFENGLFRTSFDLIYRMLSNKIMNFSSADSVTLTAVSMSSTSYPTSSMQGTPETATKSTLCNLVLKGSEGGEDIESDTIPAVSDITIVYDQVSNSGDFYNHSGSWHNDVTIPDWAECYTIVIHGNYFPSGFNLGFSYDWLVDHQTFSKFQFVGYVDPTYVNIHNAQVDYYDDLEFHKTDIIECIKFLGLLKSCDVVRIIVGDTDITGNTWTTAQDNIFFMSSYYQKLSIKGLGNIQSAVESGTYYTKALYWYTKERLDNMSGYLADYTKKSLSNQTVQNGYLQSINTNIISIKDSIDSGVNSIVSAISGISGGSSSYSLPSLSTELQRLFIPTLTWQSIDFDDYMDSIGVLSLPFTFTNDVLTVADSSYSPTLDLHINDFSLDVTGSNDVLTIFEDQDYSFNPRSIFANDVWTMLTYFNAFALILGEAWVTYCHIFRRGLENDC